MKHKHDQHEWLFDLLSEEDLFEKCPRHQFTDNCIQNMYCIECLHPVCPLCQPMHEKDYKIQIRRYVYTNVINLSEMEKLFNCDHIQTYRANGERVISIDKRPSLRETTNFGRSCTSCKKSILKEFQYCSLYCKVKYITKNKKNLSWFVMDWESPQPKRSKNGTTDESVTSPSLIEGFEEEILPVSNDDDDSVGP